MTTTWAERDRARAAWAALNTRPRGETPAEHQARMEAKAEYLRGFAAQDAKVRVITYDATESAAAIARGPQPPDPKTVTCPVCDRTRTVKKRISGHDGRCQSCARKATQPAALRPCPVCQHPTRPSSMTAAKAPGTRPRTAGGACSTCRPKVRRAAA